MLTMRHVASTGNFPVFFESSLRVRAGANGMYKRWNEHDIVKLRSLAGKLPAAKIAAEIGRSIGATVIKAHQLRLSLNTRRKKDPRSRYPEPGPAGMNFN